MKKIALSLSILTLFYQDAMACSDWNPDYDYFNLFTQSIIQDKSYVPFLLSYSQRFYNTESIPIPDENILAWQKFFKHKLNYAETKNLIYHLPLEVLQSYKKEGYNNPILKKIGNYGANKEAIDYLIFAKEIEPYAQIHYTHIENSYTYFNTKNTHTKDISNLNFEETIDKILQGYNEATHLEIKLRYGYQLVRLYHYSFKFEEAINSFFQYVEPLKIRTSPYFWAVDQMAGAQRGLRQNDKANWNFFRVFMHSPSRRESAFTSMKLSDSASFKNILSETKQPEEKSMAYFLLAYDGFGNPLPIMEKIYEIDPKSDLLKVLTAREINELERSYLLCYPYEHQFQRDNTKAESKKEENSQKEEQKSLWKKIIDFFRNLFSSKEYTSEIENESGKAPNDHELLKHPDRLPIFHSEVNNEKKEDHSKNLINFIEKAKQKSNDEFWKIAESYIYFLNKNFKKSEKILSKIKTNIPEYQEQIHRMKILNDIVSQPKIDSEYEIYLLKTYPQLFAEKEEKTSEYDYYYLAKKNSINDFIRDILANRYFIQGENGKSYLMHHKLSDLQFSPHSFLVKEVETFVNKNDKNDFEKKIIAKNINDVGDTDAFFNLIYGDYEMRLANFEKAQEYYKKALNFKGIPRYNYWSSEEKEHLNFSSKYDGFNHISSLIFGHNKMESFQSKADEVMIPEHISLFPFIPEKMNKLQLVEAILRLKKIGNGKDTTASKANQLIGNVLYNTSILGYFREIFVMDLDNSYGQKFDFPNTEEEGNFRFYYKVNHNFVSPQNFDFSLQYYQKALEQSQDDEQKSRILFQMASAEQGKYYQWESKQKPIYFESNDYEKKITFLKNEKNRKYRSYFAQLKQKYSHTKTTQSLMQSCLFFDYYMKKN